MKNSTSSQLLVVAIACLLSLAVFTFAGDDPTQVDSHSMRTTTTVH